MKKILFLTAFLLSALTATAQMPRIIVPNSHTTGYQEHTLCYTVDANVDYTVSSTADWAKVRQNGKSVYIHLDQNLLAEPRTASVLFKSDATEFQQVMTVTQTRDESVEAAPMDTYIRPSSATDNNHNGSEGISRTYDRDSNTLYHSAYSGNDVTSSNPAILTYNFKDAPHIDYLIYVPRSSGNNGNFGKVTISLKHKGETKFTVYGDYDFKESSDASTVIFNEDVRDNIIAVQFEVKSGANKFASCAEMEFYAYNDEGMAEYSIFGDDVYSTLRAGVTKADIDALENPFVKALATQLFSGTYDTKWRVAEYECYTTLQTLSERWNAPGKLYDQRAGVTGISITKGKQAVIVAGIPEGKSAGLAVTAWWTGKEGFNFDGGDPQSYTYGLHNGVNVIDYTFDYDGLAYIRYYDDDAESQPNIRVHFVNGLVNGYLNPSLTNKEMKELCTNAKNICMDVVGKRVHSVWTSEGLANYCKDSKGTGLGYRQYMNVLDSLIVWEHRSLGFEKYNRIPRNRTMAYVNFTYYMFQGGLGVSFHHNQEQRVLNCKTLIYNDNDAIWGLSHEWGHQHQMHPYFCWAGLGEVSNNVQSYYNITHMGYRTSDKIQSWPDARKHFYETTATPVKQDAVEHGMAYRGQAYKYRTEIRNAKLREVAAAQTGADTTATAYDANPRRALHINEMDVCEALTPFIMLNNYFTQNRPDGKTDTKYCDFSADWYESLRQNDDENGSQIEKKGEADKYELIASVQNGNKNNKLTDLRKRFPESCWVKNNYVDGSSQSSENSVPFILNWIRKTSRLSGYNLWPYFERFGFLRTVALRIGDYGNAWYVMNDEIYDEFKADMDALVASGELKAMDDAMVKAIFYCPDDWQPVPTIAND